MRRLWVITIAVCFGTAACNSTGKKPSGNSTSPTGKDRAPDSVPFWSDRPSGEPRERGGGLDAAPSSPEFSGIIAGTVVDASDRPVSGALVNFSEASAQPGGAPKGTETDAQGIFMIKGLKPGVTYMLTFRADEQGKVLGGAAQVKPPNSRMRIRISEDNVTSITPPAASHPGTTGPFAPKDPTKLGDPPPAKVQPPLDPVSPSKESSSDRDESYSPGKNPPASRSFPPPAAKPVPANPNVAADMSNPPPPTANIPGPGSTPLPAFQPRAAEMLPPSSPSMSAEPARSSPLGEGVAPVGAIGSRVKPRIDFTVYDLSGRPWSFRNHTGKLVLVDFWSTTCGPCINAIPKMVDLQSRFRADGLEVIGIACEEPASGQAQADAVQKVRNRFADSKYPINYRLFLEGPGFEGRVQKQFRVERYPTLVLLDDSGRELWRSDRKEATKLDDAIRYYSAK